MSTAYLDKFVGPALAKHVVPLLAEAIFYASEEAAQAMWSDPDVFQQEEARQQLMYALTDFLILGTNDHSEDHIYPPLRPHQLTREHCAVFFELDADDLAFDDPDDSATTSTTSTKESE